MELDACGTSVVWEMGFVFLGWQKVGHLPGHSLVWRGWPQALRLFWKRR